MKKLMFVIFLIAFYIVSLSIFVNLMNGTDFQLVLALLEVIGVVLISYKAKDYYKKLK